MINGAMSEGTDAWINDYWSAGFPADPLYSVYIRTSAENTLQACENWDEYQEDVAIAYSLSGDTYYLEGNPASIYKVQPVDANTFLYFTTSTLPGEEVFSYNLPVVYTMKKE